MSRIQINSGLATLAFVAVFVSGSLTTPTAVMAQLIFTDSDFDRSNWTTTVLGSGSSGSIVTQSSGGNPGAYSAITTTEGTGQWVVVADLRTGAVVDPAAVGGILSIDYSEDFLVPAHSNPLLVQGQSHGPALLQNGNFYTTNPFTIFTGVAASWTNLPLANLQTSDFAEVIPTATTPTAAFDLASNPDFSSTGAPIQFGYYRANGDVDDTITGQLDNWSMTVTAVPEPSSLAVFTIGAVSLFVGYAWRLRGPV